MCFLLFLVQFNLLELGQVFIPILILHFLIFHEFPSDHEFFDVIDRVNILHGINNDPPQNLNILEPSNNTNCATLHQNVTLSEKFQSFKSISIRANQSLPSFYESLFVPDIGSNFYDFAENTILHDPQSLLIGHTSRNQFDGISGLNNGIRIPGFLGSSHSHRPLKEIEFELDAKFHQFLLDYALTLLDVLLSVLGEQHTETTFLQEGPVDLLGVDGLDLPVVNIGVIPRLVLSVPLGFGYNEFLSFLC